MSRKQKHQPSQKSVLDVVIVSGGRFDMLRKCLDSLYREAEYTPINIYIIDHNTNAEEYRDNSELFSKRDGSSVCDFQVKHLKQDVGFPVANNDGARMGSSPLIMFLNDDVELQEGSIQKVVETFKDEPIGVVGIKLLFPLTSTSPIRPAGKVQHIGMALNIRGEPVHPLVGWSADNPKTCVSREVLFVTGACLTIRRKIWNKVGGFDPVYGMGTFEDVDLCFKVRQSGYQIYVNTDALGYHYVGATVEKKRTAYPMAQNRMTFQSRWVGSNMMIWDEWSFM